MRTFIITSVTVACGLLLLSRCTPYGEPDRDGGAFDSGLPPVAFHTLPDPVDAGLVAIGGCAFFDVQVVNDSPHAFVATTVLPEIVSLNPEDAGLEYGQAYHRGGSQVRTLDAGEAVSYRLAFLPRAAGVRQADLVVAPNVHVTLLGRGDPLGLCGEAPCDSPPQCMAGPGTCTSYSGFSGCESNTCHYAPVTGGSCDDGNPCTVNDTCSSGTCVGQIAPGIACDDGQRCSSPDRCDEAGQCHGLPNTGLSCDDGLACTSDDRCEAGECEGASACTTPPPAECVDATTYVEYGAAGTCESDGGCSYLAASFTCNEGSACVDGACE